MTAEHSDPLPLPGLPTVLRSNSGHSEQLVLLGEPQPVRIPAHLLRSWLDDPAVTARFEAKRYRRPENLCWPWTGAVSSTGHGSFRAASRPGTSRRGTIPAHLFAYQLERGVIPRLGWSNTDDAVLCHQCDFAGCTNPSHMRLGTNTTNRAEYTARRRNLASPLSDTRGAAGRTRAIAEAIRTGLTNDEGVHAVEMLILAAETAGLPLTLW
ncbi:hypothetical protein [Rhodococcus sp. H29-C3]|uniref:hypothetical protein n=1 Tax=Rhodococcus sp. H29-C3 TaxID=3046307 RepID=UPI0024BBB725|nr:hypothetical protein [Rhodococcus sp. H29-C3]MDJ0363353.1 hypothetical protein [Rhodococcus sp. H29-C3]